MITAVDTNVLIDVLGADARFGQASSRALRDAFGHGNVIACDLVWPEVAGFFQNTAGAQSALEKLTIEFSATLQETALIAGAAWKLYRQRGGVRDRVIADFLIGAHATGQADRLLTCDRGFYRTYFRTLKIIDPTST